MADDEAPPVAIRPAGRGDGAAITGILAEGFDSYRAWAGPDWRPPQDDASTWAVLTEDGSAEDRCWVAVGADGAVLGVVRTASTSRAIRTAPDGAVILRQLFVARRAWGTGVGRALLDHGLRAARDDGYDAMWLAAAEGSEQARSFYARHGFVERARNRDAGLGLGIVVYTRAL